MLCAPGRNDPLDPAVATPAGCKPELQVVPLVPAGSDPAILTWPSCTRVERCGGCCSSELLHCAPVRTSALHVKVAPVLAGGETTVQAVKARYRPTRDDRLEYEGYQTYEVQRHERCTCQCRQTEKDCSAAQIYQPDQCRCVCAASAESCRGPDHYWDLKECRCRCKSVLQCSSGFTFSTSTCR
ncbi:PDGFB [Cordylochernes scorpioides]|uniref:PDGFB n=1 Tax=Cordylochernes scorpioides TaxID=51811 RepID=A0ABY6JXY1_9ARAC|nr:PDGFB [Cordylochernes scorpioides]